MTLTFDLWPSKLEWGCPNGTKYPPRQPIPNRAILPNRERVYRRTDRQTDGQGDSSITPLTSLRGGIINRVHPLIKVNMSAKFDEEAHNGFSLYGVHKLISIYVHYDLDFWPSKSIGFILSPWLTCLQSLIKKSTTVKSLLHSQAYFHRCPLWPWPLTSDLLNQ